MAITGGDGLPSLIVCWSHHGYTWAIQQRGKTILTDDLKTGIVYPDKTSAYQAGIPLLRQALERSLVLTYGTDFVTAFAAAVSSTSTEPN